MTLGLPILVTALPKYEGGTKPTAELVLPEGREGRTSRWRNKKAKIVETPGEPLVRTQVGGPKAEWAVPGLVHEGSEVPKTFRSRSEAMAARKKAMRSG